MRPDLKQLDSEISVSGIGERYRQRQRPTTNLKHTTDRVLADLVCDSVFFEENPARAMAHFQPNELETGHKLGEGEFGIVYEVSCLCLVDGETQAECANHSSPPPTTASVPTISPPHSIVLVSPALTSPESSAMPLLPESEPSRDGLIGKQLTPSPAVLSSSTVDFFDSVSEVDPDDDLSLHDHLHDTRQTMSTHVLREGQARYAVKRLKETLKIGSKEHFDAAIDLSCEAKFLSSISHSNIIRLRGVVGEPGTCEYALVLDRLVCTLEQRMMEWKQQQHKYSGFLGLGRKTTALKQLMADRLLAAFDIARAMRHLHYKRILYRDLKPDNIGLDVRGNVRIFDFGLAKELKQCDLKEEPDRYDATGLTGSRRYMSPECARCRYYGFSADVYSFAILIWEILALQTPYANYDSNRHYENVVGKGKRPPQLKNLPLYPLMEAAWAEDPSERPSFQQICVILQTEIRAHVHYTSIGIDDRSNYLTDRSVASMNDE